MSKLEAILSQEVEAEIQALLEAARREGEAALGEAKAKAEALLQARKRALEAALEAAIRRAESAGELLLSKARAEAKGEVLGEVRARVEAALAGLRQDPKWPSVLQKLAEEALEALGEAEALEAHPEDLPHLEGLARARGLALRPNPQLDLGVKAVGRGGKTQAENTLKARLERAWETLAARVAQAMWG